MGDSVVLIADDHPLFRAALTQAVAQCLPGADIVEADGMPQLEAAAAAHPNADLALLDLKMPGARGFSSLVFLRGQHPAIPVIVISAADDADVVRRAQDFGASGFLSKASSVAAIGAAINAVMAGDTAFPDTPAGNESDADLATRLEALTLQQFRVLMLLADGLPNEQIADELDVSEATIKAHMTAIMRKLGIFSRTQAALIAQRMDVTDPALDADSGD